MSNSLRLHLIKKIKNLNEKNPKIQLTRIRLGDELDWTRAKKSVYTLNRSTETANLTITVSSEVLDADLWYITADNDAIVKFSYIWNWFDREKKKFIWTLILF